MRTKFYLLLIALVTTVGSVWGQREKIGELTYDKVGTNAIIVIADHAAIGAANGILTIPKEVQFSGDTAPSPVVEIRGTSPFMGCTTLKELTILANLTTMASFAFHGCPNLEKLRIEGNGVVGHRAFEFCPKLTTVELLGTLTIGSYAFNNSGLTGTFPIGLNITSVGVGAFGGCPIDGFDVDINHSRYKDIDGVIFSKDERAILHYPSGRGGTYTIPSIVTEIEHCTFMYNTLLTEIVIPEGITTIKDAAFFGCTGLTKILLPESLKHIGYQTFRETGLVEISIPANVNNIGYKAFEKNPYLKTVIFNGKTMPEIVFEPFSECDNLENIYLPSNSDDYDDLDLSELGITGITPDVILGITVDFNSNGGNINVPQKVFKTATAVKEPTVPSRTGFAFDAWYNDGTKWNFSQLVTASMTLTAEWNEIIPPTQYTVTLESLAGVTLERKTAGAHPVDEGGSFAFGATANANGYRVIVYVNGTEHAPTSDNFYLIEGIDEDKTVTFALAAGTYNDDSIVGGITINGEPLDDKKTDFPEEGKIVITFNDDADTNVSGKVIIDGKEVPGTWGTDSNGNPTYTIDYAVTGDGEHTIKIEGFGGDGETHTFTTGGGSGNNGNGGKIVIDGSTPDLGGGFPPTGEIVVYPPVVTYPETPTVTIDGEDVTGTWEKDEDGKDIYVVGYDDLEDGEHTIIIDGEEFTFEIDGENGNGGNTGGGGKVVIDDTTPPNLPGEFPGDGEIVVYPPVVTYPNIPSVTIDGKEVVPGGTWGTDDDGKPIFVIEYEGLEDGEHTIVVNGKEYTFTVKNGGATSNDVLSVAKVTASYGTVTIDAPKSSTVYVVSLSGSVVYNAKVTGTVTVNVPAGIYVVVVDGTATKIVVR
jgi:Listeria/Bacterioides repeat